MAKEHLSNWVVALQRQSDEGSSRRQRQRKLYKSRHDPTTVPAYSTFRKSKPSEVSKNDLPPRKPALPNRKDEPRYGLKTDKNFVVVNAVEAILGAKQPAKNSGKQKRSNQQDGDEPMPPRKHNDFGRVPGYLKEVRESIAMEKLILQEYFDDLAASNRTGPATEAIADADRDALIKQLKRKWGSINQSYQKACGGAESATKDGLKEKLEKQLEQIESDIKLLSKGNIKVLLDQ